MDKLISPFAYVLDAIQLSICWLLALNNYIYVVGGWLTPESSIDHLTPPHEFASKALTVEAVQETSFEVNNKTMV